MGATLQTFMVRGLSGKWKQPVGFFYCAGPLPATFLEQLLNDCIRKVRSAGLKVMSVVCDMGSPNRQLYKTRLGVSVDRPFFDVDGERVFALYDPPHLLKSLRNCLFGNDVGTPEGVVSWSHVAAFYAEDCKRALWPCGSVSR